MKLSKIQTFLPLACCVLCSASGSSLHLALRLPRGGSEPYEINPNYVSPPSAQVVGDLEKRRQRPSQQQVYIETRQFRQPSPIEQVTAYATQLHRTSPTLSIGSVSCILIWLLWQRPQAHGFLNKNFVCSRRNIGQGRLLTTLTSAVSHASFTHLLVNLFAFLSFGPSLVKTLSSSNWKLWPLVVGAASFSSHVFLMLSRDGGGCMGLSGVTLAFLALEARLHPERELGVYLMGIVPIRMPAQVMLYCLLAWSLVGSVVKKGRVAHSAHLGGLLFGMGYYELWMHRAVLRRIRRAIWCRGQVVPAR